MTFLFKWNIIFGLFLLFCLTPITKASDDQKEASNDLTQVQELVDSISNDSKDNYKEKIAPELTMLMEQREKGDSVAEKKNVKNYNLNITNNQKEKEQDQVTVILESFTGKSKDIDLKLVEKLGGTIRTTSKSFVEVNIPINRLKDLAEHPDIKIIRSPSIPQPEDEFANIYAPGIYLNAVNGISAQKLGITGQGVAVAVIDIGFIGLTSEKNHMELPNNLTAVDFTGNNDVETGTDHGTIVAQQVVDMAPNVTLYCLKVGNEISFENAVQYLIDNNIRVVNCSLGWLYSSYYDNIGPLCDAVNNSRFNNNIFWAVAAGNYGQCHWKGIWSDPDNDGVLNFSSSDEEIRTDENIQPSDDTEITIILSWNQFNVWPRTDLNLFVYNKWNQGVTESVRSQLVSSGEPWEKVIFTYNSSEAPYKICVKHLLWSPSPDGVDISLFCINADLESDLRVSTSSIPDPGCASGAFTVAAYDYDNNTIFGLSSQGPTTDGRMKPDISAPGKTQANVYVTTPSPNFVFGTSVASPLVAGMAALLLQQDPTLTASQIEDVLRHTAIDCHWAVKTSHVGANQNQPN